MQQVEIWVKGHLDRTWADRLGGLDITHTSDGNTVLSGPLRDQAALQGILSRLAALGIELISVNTSSRKRVPERLKKGGGERKRKK